MTTFLFCAAIVFTPTVSPWYLFSHIGIELIIERVALPSGPDKALARRFNHRRIRIRRQRRSAVALYHDKQLLAMTPLINQAFL
jgi:hypothetical protein